MANTATNVLSWGGRLGSALGNAAKDPLVWTIGLLTAAFAWLFDTFNYLAEYAKSQWPNFFLQMNEEALRIDTYLGVVQTFVSWIDNIFPVAICTGIIGATYCAKLVIRATRWALGFIPWLHLS